MGLDPSAQPMRAPSTRKRRVRRLVILGAGGHAREVLDLVRICATSARELETLGFISEDPASRRQVIAGLPVLGDFGWFAGTDPGEIEVICAVGRPEVCRRFGERAEALGLRFASVVAPSAGVSPGATLGRGVTLFPNVVVNTGARIGDHVILNVATTVSHDSVVGPWCNVNPGVHLAGNVTVGEGCYLGMGSNVLQGIKVGDWTTVGAGAVVVEDLPPRVTAVGVPARVIKHHSG